MVRQMRVSDLFQKVDVGAPESRNERHGAFNNCDSLIDDWRHAIVSKNISVRRLFNDDGQ